MENRALVLRISLSDLLRKLGMYTLYVFFYIYSAGNALGISSWYSLTFNIATFIAVLLMLQNLRVLNSYKYYYIWQFAFIFLLLASSLYTINTEHWSAQFMAVVKILMKITVVAIICGNFIGVKKLLAGFSVLGPLIFLTLLATGKLYEGWRLGTDLLGNANSFAHIITIMMTGAMYFAFSAEQKKYRIVNIIFIIIDLYMIFLSGGRKFILYGVVFTYVSLVMRSKRIKIKNIIIATIIVVVLLRIGYQIIMNTPALYSTIGIRLVGIGTTGAMGVGDQQRLMQRGIEMFKESPIFGKGIGGFQQYSSNVYGSYVYAHSNYIELLADFGLVGFILYYYRYIRSLVRMIRYRNIIDEKYRLFFPLLIAIFVLDIFSISFNQTAFIPLFVMLISSYADSLTQQVSNSNEEHI